LRRGKSLGATWQDADLEQGFLEIHQARYVVNGEAGFDPAGTDPIAQIDSTPWLTLINFIV
jgi:hypothetical protein